LIELALIGLAIAILAIVAAVALRRPAPKQAAAAAAPAPERDVPTLEQQIENLANAGLRLSAGVTIDDLLHSFPREEFESAPYTTLLFMFGVEIEREPWGRHFSDVAWDFDYERIDGPGSYVAIVNELARITGRAGIVSNVTDNVDMRAPTATVTCTIGGKRRTLEAQMENDWADPEAVQTIARDIEAAVGDGRTYWAADNGQAVILFFISGETAAKVNALTNGALTRYT
jgi:predicted transcriptional regulator